jgi:formate-dependent nitrite reductase membrane component NrfD
LDPDEKKRSAEEREAQLLQIRHDAENAVRRSAAEIEAPRERGLPSAAAAPGYYGLPVLKTPPWTWEIPIYFFVGGAAGAAAVVARVAEWSHAEPELVRDARWIAAIGGAISPALLVSDLGYPRRFFNMLRVFKLQSPMSVGSWTLVAFSSSAAAAAFLSIAQRRPSAPLRIVTNAADMLAAISGTVLATYTGVLIGATAVPVWHENISILPIHFAISGLSSAASILELRGHETPALNALGLAACAGETMIGAKIELDNRPASAPLKTGTSGWLTRIGGMLSGPLPLVLRVIAGFARKERSVKLRKAAAISSIAGSLITRAAWISAGKVSAKNPRLELRGVGLPGNNRATPTRGEI